MTRLMIVVGDVAVLRLYKSKTGFLLAVVSTLGDLKLFLRRGGGDDGAAAEALGDDDVCVR
jgi:hypothetical protein